MLSAFEGMVLFLGLVLFLIILIRSTKKDTVVEEVDETLAVVSNFKIGTWLAIGAVSLYFGSEWLVDGAKAIALSIGVSEAVIGVSLIAIGTSVPELAASVIAAAKQEKAISLGNLIGSNIFNIASVLGLTAIITPIPVTESSILTSDIFWMLGFALVLFPLMLLPKKFEINRAKGFFLVFVYGVFMFLLFTAGK
jgi:cation:H+ antiporter